MKRVNSIGVLFAIIVSSNVMSASEIEYIEFIEKNGKALLETFRLPVDEDLSFWGTDTDTYFYKTLDSELDAKAPYWTKGDFNDDEQSDYLYIMFNKLSNEAHLIGFMSSQESYEEVIIEKSGKTMVIATKQNLAIHFHLEGHGHALSWNKAEAKFNVIQ